MVPQYEDELAHYGVAVIASDSVSCRRIGRHGHEIVQMEGAVSAIEAEQLSLKGPRVSPCTESQVKPAVRTPTGM